MDFTLGYFIGAIIVGVICGCISKAIASNRGMDGGFWWGFWLTIIGIVVVAVRPNDNKPAYEPRPKTREEEENEIIANGGWRCDNCGKVNYHYMTSCRYCNESKREQERKRYLEKIKAEEENQQQKEEKSSAAQIKEFKELLDDGIITQEEFDAKKKQLLGL